MDKLKCYDDAYQTQTNQVGHQTGVNQQQTAGQHLIDSVDEVTAQQPGQNKHRADESDRRMPGDDLTDQQVNKADQQSRSAGLTAVVAKTSAGAVSYMPVARVPNIPALLKDLQKQGVWVFGTAAEGTTTLYNADLKGAAAIVIGSEGDGMSRLVRENCDFLVSIPMKGHINSLNASAAAAILLYEAVRQRLS